MKINFDGSIFSESGEIGAGFISKNSKEECLGWGQPRIKHLVVAEYAELYACVEALSFAKRSTWTRMSLEGDCLQLIQKLAQQGQDVSAMGAIRGREEGE